MFEPNSLWHLVCVALWRLQGYRILTGADTRAFSEFQLQVPMPAGPVVNLGRTICPDWGVAAAASKVDRPQAVKAGTQYIGILEIPKMNSHLLRTRTRLRAAVPKHMRGQVGHIIFQMSGNRLPQPLRLTPLSRLPRMFPALTDQQLAVVAAYILVESRSDLDSLAELSDIESMRLQMVMNRRSKFVEALSNIMKKIDSTQETIVQNLKG